MTICDTLCSHPAMLFHSLLSSYPTLHTHCCILLTLYEHPATIPAYTLHTHTLRTIFSHKYPPHPVNTPQLSADTMRTLYTHPAILCHTLLTPWGTLLKLCKHSATICDTLLHTLKTPCQQSSRSVLHTLSSPLRLSVSTLWHSHILCQCLPHSSQNTFFSHTLWNSSETLQHTLRQSIRNTSCSHPSMLCHTLLTSHTMRHSPHTLQLAAARSARTLSAGI